LAQLWRRKLRQLSSNGVVGSAGCIIIVCHGSKRTHGSIIVLTLSFWKVWRGDSSIKEKLTVNGRFPRITVTLFQEGIGGSRLAAMVRAHPTTVPCRA
jgi:hypothetical protein